ncbi:hypothetical protein BJ138DRAFT_871847 [Hygrophoropsis aurantiaca]|uniref:Uncharacterized protein n=1 Tax=Hygrophoropsis aurantiaca TaxID=72124 RepID=A0ACB7ZVK3_9AGAM|nr:hypothetical protein BJ138DRAFT_871847 [Hygrophoropsis aurantiaca]
MAFYLHTEYDWRAFEPGDDPCKIDIEIDTPSEPAAFWDIFGALWSKYPKAPDADAPLRHGVVSEVGIGVDYQRIILTSPPAQHAQEEEVDITHGMVEDLNDKILASEGTISALHHVIEAMSHRHEQDQRQFHDDLGAKQATIDGIAEQMADKDLIVTGSHRTARLINLRHDDEMSKIRDEAAAKQRVINDLTSGLRGSAEEQARQEAELAALRQEVSQLKDANSELTLVNSMLKADLGKLADAVVQMFPGSDDEDDDEDGDDDDDPRDQPLTTPPAPQMMSRIPRWTPPRKKPLLTPASQITRVFKPDAALTPAMVQPDAVASSFLPIFTLTSRFKTRSAVFLSDAPRRRRLPLQKTLHSQVTSTSTNTSTRSSTIVLPNTVAKKISTRKPFLF